MALFTMLVSPFKTYIVNTGIQQHSCYKLIDVENLYTKIFFFLKKEYVWRSPVI
jgi:hypothetical protein